jgi:hypothetical protein
MECLETSSKSTQSNIEKIKVLFENVDEDQTNIYSVALKVFYYAEQFINSTTKRCKMTQANDDPLIWNLELEIPKDTDLIKFIVEVNYNRSHELCILKRQYNQPGFVLNIYAKNVNTLDILVKFFKNIERSKENEPNYLAEEDISYIKNKDNIKNIFSNVFINNQLEDLSSNKEFFYD